MNLFQLRYFVTLAKMQHYTKAAHELCITQPSLSHAISQLEAELGVALLKKRTQYYTHKFWGRVFNLRKPHACHIGFRSFIPAAERTR